jgi:hypothetical protein
MPYQHADKTLAPPRSLSSFSAVSHISLLRFDLRLRLQCPIAPLVMRRDMIHDLAATDSATTAVPQSPRASNSNYAANVKSHNIA